MRIAWISYCFEEYSALHVNALCREHDVLLVLPEPRDGAATYALDPAVEHYSFVNPRLRQPLRQWFAIRGILQRIRVFQPDVIHLQQGHLWLNLALRGLCEYPLVVTVHDPRHHAGDATSRKTPQWILDAGFRRADQIIVHGEALAAQVESLFACPRERIHVIPHVAMGADAVAGPVAEDEHLILFFGRIWEYKGLDQLIAAQPLITAAAPEARIMIAGEGEDFGKYQAMMQDPTRFIVHNRWISDDERASLFRQSALVVLPYNEATQSGVVPVAHNYSKPVVATRVGALAECVDDGVTGLLIPPRDPTALAEAIISLLKNPARRRQMGQAGKALLDRNCSPPVVAAQTVRAYQAAIELRRRSVPSNAARRIPSLVKADAGGR